MYVPTPMILRPTLSTGEPDLDLSLIRVTKMEKNYFLRI